MNNISFILVVIGILLLGPIIGFLLYKISPKKKDTSLLCNTNRVLAKFDNTREYEISIDEVIKEDFKLLDM